MYMINDERTIYLHNIMRIYYIRMHKISYISYIIFIYIQIYVMTRLRRYGAIVIEKAIHKCISCTHTYISILPIFIMDLFITLYKYTVMESEAFFFCCNSTLYCYQ